MITLGQTVYYVARDRRDPNPQACQVTKIGRKWVTFGGGHWADRFELGEGDGPFAVDAGEYTSRADVWLSLEARERYLAAQVAWERLGQLTKRGTRPPPHITAEQIDAIVAQLRGME